MEPRENSRLRRAFTCSAGQESLRVDLRFRIGPDAVQLQLVALVGLVGRFRGRRGLVLRGLLIVADRSPTGVADLLRTAAHPTSLPA